MSRRWIARTLIGGAALTVLAAGLLGAWSYGQAYSRDRGFVSVAQLPRAGTGRLLNVNFYSRALHRQAYYLVYLPPGYHPAERYPVMYLLHGMPGRPQVFIDIANMDVRLDNQLSSGHLHPMILVFPDGRIGGSTYSDSEWANTPSGAFENYVVDVVHDVEDRFSTGGVPEARVIGGFSAGAYGAINIALHHWPLFGSVQLWSGYFTQDRTGVFAHASRAALAYNSPLAYVGGLPGRHALSPLRVFMFVGRDDESSRQIVPMARTLRARGARVQYAIYAGGHDWQVWYPRLNQMLILGSQDVGPPRPTSGSLGRSRRHRAGGGRRGSNGGTGVGTGAGRLTSAARLIGSLVLALTSAAAINLGFLLQHQGLAGLPSGRRAALRAALLSPHWLAGQVIGWLGFGAQILALAFGPISLVQAFAAGGLAISVPVAAVLFRHRVSRVQVLAVSLIAASLASLPIALPRGGGHLHAVGLLCAALGALPAAAGLGLQRSASARAVAAGVCYAVADAAIKAVSIGLRAHGAGSLLSGWTALAVVATFGGFVAFQAALRSGEAVSAISLMTACTALAAVGFGVFTFGESLGARPAAVLVHLVAISLVLACVPLLARAQEQIADGRPVAA